MHFYLKEWPDYTVTLMTADNLSLWTFNNLDDAYDVCRQWYALIPAPTQAPAYSQDLNCSICAI